MSFVINPQTGKLENDGKCVLSVEVIAGQTKVADIIPATAFKKADYSVTVSNDTEGVLSTYFISVSNGASLKETLYGRLGDYIDHTFDTGINSGNYELVFENNETYNLTIRLNRSFF